MLVPYQSLLQLPDDTLENLIKEFLFTQMEDGSFAALDQQALATAITRCKEALSAQKLVVEYSENDQSIAIKHSDDTPHQSG